MNVENVWKPWEQALVLVLVSVLLCMLAYLGHLMKVPPVMSDSDYIQIFISFIIFMTLVATVYAQHKVTDRAASAAYLSASVDLLNKAHSVLNDEEVGLRCDRISWVTAARLLSRSDIIANKISTTSHKDIYHSEKDFQRHRLYHLLSIDGKPLPIEFFFGSGYIKGDVGASAYSTLENGEIEWIPTNIVSQVYRFIEFPLDYDDPLDGSDAYSEAELQNNISLSDQGGVCGYLRIRTHLRPTGSKKVFLSWSGSVSDAKVIDSKKINTLLLSLTEHNF